MEVDYKLPIFGNKIVSFYNDAQEIYSFLEEKGQISRLKNLNQLGIISDVIQTAHHPRYEYIFLLCLLVDRIKHSVRGYYPVATKFGTVTGSELLKIWALLLAIGHTPGGFPVEKAILKYLVNKNKKRKEFVKPITDSEIKKYALKLIDDNNIYSFYHILSFLKIFRYGHKKKGKKLSKKYASYLSSYCLESRRESYLKLKELFRKLRRLSYIILDSYYTGTLVLTDLDTIISKTASAIPDPNFDELVRCLDSYLLNQIYRSNDSIITEIILYHSFYEKLTRNKKPLSLIDNYLYSTTDQEICRLYDDFKRGKRITEESDKFLEPLSIYTGTSKVFKQEQDINNIINRFVPEEKTYERALFDVTRLPGSNNNKITVYVNRNYEFKRTGLLPNLLKIVIGEIIRNESAKYNPLFRIKEIRKLPHIQFAVKKQINENNLISIFRFLTRIIFDNKVGSIRFKSKGIPLLPSAFFDRSHHGKECLLEQVANRKIVDDPEVIKLKELIIRLSEEHVKERPKFLIYTLNTELQRQKASVKRWGFVMGEFDGALLEIRGTKIFMYILEAKKKTRSYGESRKQLRKIKSYLKKRYRKKNICKIERIKKGEKSGILRIKLS